jgi:hypothetical protein
MDKNEDSELRVGISTAVSEGNMVIYTIWRGMKP